MLDKGSWQGWMPVVSADPDTPLGIRNQRTEGTLLQRKWENDRGKRDLAAAGGGCSCKGMACGCDIVDDNMGDDSEGMCGKSLKRNK